jgi:hypothetical protein
MSMMVKPKLDGEDWLRQWTVPEEDRHEYTSTPWAGGYRWFRAANIVCLETWRRQKRQPPEK